MRIKILSKILYLNTLRHKLVQKRRKKSTFLMSFDNRFTRLEDAQTNY